MMGLTLAGLLTALYIAIAWSNYLKRQNDKRFIEMMRRERGKP